MAMIVVFSAVAPVAQALCTLKTGMPVWPICFCSIWPIGAAPPMRLPAARMPMSFMVTPASARAAMAAWAARSTVSRSGCLPNFVMLIPRMKTSSLIASRSQGLVAEADGLGAVVVRPGHERGQLDLHAERHVLGIRIGVDHVAAHRGAVAVDDPGHERHGHTGGGEGHDGERLQLALVGDRGVLELGGEARGTGVAAVEELRPAARALLGHQVRVVAQHQVVDDGNSAGHPAPLWIGSLRQCLVAGGAGRRGRTFLDRNMPHMACSVTWRR